jgi:hypothetical protein
VGQEWVGPRISITDGRYAEINTKTKQEAGDPSYRTVKGILAAGTEDEGFQPPLPGIDVPAWLRGPGAFGGEQP